MIQNIRHNPIYMESISFALQFSRSKISNNKIWTMNSMMDQVNKDKKKYVVKYVADVTDSCQQTIRSKVRWQIDGYLPHYYVSFKQVDAINGSW